MRSHRFGTLWEIYRAGDWLLIKCCSCGHEKTVDPFPLICRFRPHVGREQMEERFRCTACGSRLVQLEATPKPDPCTLVRLSPDLVARATSWKRQQVANSATVDQIIAELIEIGLLTEQLDPLG